MTEFYSTGMINNFPLASYKSASDPIVLATRHLLLFDVTVSKKVNESRDSLFDSILLSLWDMSLYIFLICPMLVSIIFSLLVVFVISSHNWCYMIIHVCRMMIH